MITFVLRKQSTINNIIQEELKHVENLRGRSFSYGEGGGRTAPRMSGVNLSLAKTGLSPAVETWQGKPMEFGGGRRMAQSTA
jgi:hypothetical protein